MPRHGKNPEDADGIKDYQEVPLVVYSGGRRVRVGIASVFKDGIAAHFDAMPNDSLAKQVIEAIVRGAFNGLSIAPTPEHDPDLSDYIKESG
jgi:hypothetical protein